MLLLYPGELYRLLGASSSFADFLRIFEIMLLLYSILKTDKFFKSDFNLSKFFLNEPRFLSLNIHVVFKFYMILIKRL